MRNWLRLFCLLLSHKVYLQFVDYTVEYKNQEQAHILSVWFNFSISLKPATNLLLPVPLPSCATSTSKQRRNCFVMSAHTGRKSDEDNNRASALSIVTALLYSSRFLPILKTHWTPMYYCIKTNKQTTWTWGWFASVKEVAELSSHAVIWILPLPFIIIMWTYL